VQRFGEIATPDQVGESLEKLAHVNAGAVQIKQPLREHRNRDDGADEDWPHQQSALLEVFDHSLPREVASKSNRFVIPGAVKGSLTISVVGGAERKARDSSTPLRSAQNDRSVNEMLCSVLFASRQLLPFRRRGSGGGGLAKKFPRAVVGGITNLMASVIIAEDDSAKDSLVFGQMNFFAEMIIGVVLI
jgi:hypothetical protein